MKIYHVSADVLSVNGSQTFRVLARTEEEALEMIGRGGGYLDSEEIKVTKLGPWTVTGEEGDSD